MRPTTSQGDIPRARFPVPVPTNTTRIIGAAVAVPGLAVLGVAWFITPSPLGHGSHTDLGLPACGFFHTTGIPCMTCGMTTSFAHAVRGELITAIHTQPAGAMMAIATAGAVLIGLYSACTGVSFGPMLRPLSSPKPLLFAGFVFLAAWAYKIFVILGP